MCLLRYFIYSLHIIQIFMHTKVTMYRASETTVYLTFRTFEKPTIVE